MSWIAPLQQDQPSPSPLLSKTLKLYLRPYPIVGRGRYVLLYIVQGLLAG